MLEKTFQTIIYSQTRQNSHEQQIILTGNRLDVGFMKILSYSRRIRVVSYIEYWTCTVVYEILFQIIIYCVKYHFTGTYSNIANQGEQKCIRHLSITELEQIAYNCTQVNLFFF